MTPGIHLVHKPEGPTSFSVVQQFITAARGPHGQKGPKICHGGTLDPFASGLLLILVEPATRLFEFLHGVPKVYEATVRWGIETDNGDPFGRIISAKNSSGLEERQLEQALTTFVGWQEQIPHSTSAKRIDGERAYLKAHRGEEVIMPASRVYLHSAEWLEHSLPNKSRLRITSLGGYYVRALVRDLGRLVGCGAHLMQLHRSAIGPWNDPGPEDVVELQGRDILPWVATRILSGEDVSNLREKRDIPVGDLLTPDWPLPEGFVEPNTTVRGFHGGKFCYLLSVIGDQLRLLTELRGGI